MCATNSLSVGCNWMVVKCNTFFTIIQIIYGFLTNAFRGGGEAGGYVRVDGDGFLNNFLMRVEVGGCKKPGRGIVESNIIVNFVA